MLGWVALAGVVLLAAAFAYAMLRNRDRTRREAARTEAATNAQYREDRPGDPPA